MIVKKILKIIIPIVFVFAAIIIIYSFCLPIGIQSVPDEQTAIKIAEAVWLPIFGEEIYNELPFEAKLIPFFRIWYVHGSIPEAEAGWIVGGVVEIGIRQSDGKILFVRHEK